MFKILRQVVADYLHLSCLGHIFFLRSSIIVLACEGCVPLVNTVKDCFGVELFVLFESISLYVKSVDLSII